jgi:hypothetical protein
MGTVFWSAATWQTDTQSLDILTKKSRYKIRFTIYLLSCTIYFSRLLRFKN